MNTTPLVLLVLLIVLVVVIVGPVIGFVMLFRRINSPKGRVVLTVGYFGIPLSVLFFFGFLGSSRARVERDHSLILSASASHIRCTGLVSITTFGDFDASASFEIPRTDLLALLSQFSWDADTKASSVKSVGELMSVPRQFGKPNALYSGFSRGGNRVDLQTYDIGETHLGVCIYTMWN